MKAKKLHKGYLILTIVIIALILAASYVSVRLLHRSPASGNNDIAVGKEDIAGSEETDSQTNQSYDQTGDAGAGNGEGDLSNGDLQDDSQDIQDVNIDEPILRNSVNIIDNSPEFEVEMYVMYNNENIPFIEIRHYYSGVSRSVVYTTDHIPSLKEFGDTFRISSAVLNPRYAKLYFFVEKELSRKEVLFDFYVYDLKNSEVKKLTQGKGYDFNRLVFSPDKAYGAFCYLSDDEGKYSLLQVFDCISNEMLAEANKTKEGKYIGNEPSDKEVYSYFITRWRSSDELQLKEYAYNVDSTGKPASESKSEKTVVYNVKEGRIIYPEETEKGGNNTSSEGKAGEGGSTGEKDYDVGGKDSGVQGTQDRQNVQDAQDIRQDGGQKGQEQGRQINEQNAANNQDNTESKEQGENSSAGSTGNSMGDSTDNAGKEAISALEKFYGYIGNGQYYEAYDLLDDNFIFSAFKIFGNITLSKADIDVEYFKAFIEATGIFKDIQIKEIKGAKTEGDTSKVYYYHSMVIASDSGQEQEMVMPIVATIKKTGNVWKISAFSDWNVKAEPF